MQVSIKRLLAGTSCTLGSVLVDGEWECFSWEPPVRADRVFISGESALPLGLYNVTVTRSPRHGGVFLPLLVSTDRTRGLQHAALAMRIHPSHTVPDIYTGILLGQAQGPTTVYHSKPAFDAFLAKLREATDHGEAIDLEIS